MQATNDGLKITVEMTYKEAALLSIIVDEYSCRNRVEWAEEFSYILHNPESSTSTASDARKGDR